MNQQKQHPALQNSVKPSFEEGFFLSSETYIHPSAVIGSDVTLGHGVKIGPGCVIVGKVSIGDETRIYAHTTIGLPAQDVKTPEPLGSVVIGKKCTIREYVSIHAPKIHDGITRVGDSCYLMNHSHVGHDATLEDNVILINNANLGGHVYVEKGAIIMAGAALHQFCRVGTLSCLTPFSGARQDLPPYSMFTGQPAHFSSLNKVGLARAGLTPENIAALKNITHLFYQEKKLLEVIEQEIQNFEWGNDPYVQAFLEFVRTSKRGVSRRTLSYGTSVFY